MTETCRECGMPVDAASTYHPYAACLMFKACGDGEVVQANLDAVVAHGYQMAREDNQVGAEDMEPMRRDAIRYRWLRDMTRNGHDNKIGKLTVWAGGARLDAAIDAESVA